MGNGGVSEEVIRALKEIDARLRIIEETLGISYDDEGIIDPKIVKELLKREKERSVDEGEFWRAAGVED